MAITVEQLYSGRQGGIRWTAERRTARLQKLKTVMDGIKAPNWKRRGGGAFTLKILIEGRNGISEGK